MGTLIGTLALVIAVVALGMVIDQRFPLLPRPDPQKGTAPTRSAAGATPATAAAASARQHVVDEQRCCATAMVEAEVEPISYGGRPLLIVRVRCPSCGEQRSLYVDPG